MTSTDPLDGLRRAARRATLEDGVAEIFAGVYTLMVAVATQRRMFLALAAAYLVAFVPAWRWIHASFAGPRVGYAEVPDEPPALLLASVLGAGLAALAVVAAVTLGAGDLWGLDRWPNWPPVLAGAVLAAGHLAVAVRSRVRRFHAYAALAVCGAVFYWQFPFGPRINPSDRLTLFLFSMAGVQIVAGWIVAVRFARAHPVLKEEARHDA